MSSTKCDGQHNLLKSLKLIIYNLRSLVFFPTWSQWNPTCYIIKFLILYYKFAYLRYETGNSKRKIKLLTIFRLRILKFLLLKIKNLSLLVSVKNNFTNAKQPSFLKWRLGRLVKKTNWHLWWIYKRFVEVCERTNFERL